STKRRWRVDERGIPVRVQQHWCSDDTPGVFIHELILIQDKIVSIVATERIRVKGCLGSDTDFGTGKLNQLAGRVFVDYAPIYGRLQGPFHLKPEAVNLFLRGDSI